MRGTTLDEPNQGTQLFSKTVLKIFDAKGCIDIINEDKFVNIPKLREEIERNTIDLQMFSDALGNKALKDGNIF